MKKNNYYLGAFSRFGFLAVILFTVIFFAANGFKFSKDINKSEQQKHSQVRILSMSETDINKLENYGLLLDHGINKPGQYFETWLSESELELLNLSGVPYEITIDDWDAYYSDQPPVSSSELDRINKTPYKDWIISHSIYGTMGPGGVGYLTYDQVVQKLDSLRIEYPQFVSQKFSIGATYENRQQWVVKITKNPESPNTRPQVWLHALIHAREPEAMTQQLYFVYWLLENANTDPEARYILNNREIHWMPVYNADGYVYNQTTNPNGGGMWRKTRKPCGSGTGADPNRNFGTYYFWNYPNGGSSTSCGSDTYRGSLPFSEQENLNVLNYVNSKQFKTNMSAHTYGNYLIKPWSHLDPVGTPDDATFNLFLNDMKASNGYTAGFPSQTVGYKVRGGTDDWYYNDSGHSKIFGITPETGASFWPATNLMLPLAQTMLYSNKYMVMVAGPWVNPTSLTFNQTTYNPGQSGTYKINFKNKGLMAAQNVKVMWTPNLNTITIPVQQYNYASLASFASDSATFNFTVGANAPVNCAIPTTLTIKLDTTTILSQSVYVYVGQGNAALNDQANNFNNWTTNGPWNITTSQSYSPPSSFTDSPTGQYGNNINYYMQLTNPINVNSQPVVYLSFWHRYQTEAGYDFCYVEASSDNGSTWSQVASYNGSMTSWSLQSFDITQYANATSQLKIRFRITSDVSVTGDGWYVDDIKLTSYCLGFVGTQSNTELPQTFALSQNYPNPFNPVTTIKYQLPVKSLVTVKLFDVSGREVATIVNEEKEAGYYNIDFNAASLSSGIYFYRINAGSFEDTKKMILVK